MTIRRRYTVTQKGASKLEDSLKNALTRRFWDKNLKEIADLVGIEKRRFWRLYHFGVPMYVHEYEKILRFLPYFTEKVQKSKKAFLTRQEYDDYYEQERNITKEFV